MRGVGSARILEKIEELTGSSVQKVFDLVCGTSTGSILACLAAAPSPRPASQWKEFYYEAGPRIFQNPWLVGPIKWALAPRYSANNLQNELRKSIGEHRLADAATHCMIPTLDAESVDAVFLKSWRPEHQEWLAWEAAGASASAQTFFPAFKRGGRRYIDGGSFANNPSASALFEASQLWPNEPIALVSVGTGRQISPKALPDGGLLKWAPLLFDTCSETQDDVADYFCRSSPIRYLKVDFELDSFPGMDDARPQTLKKIEKAADAWLSANSRPLENFLSWM